MFGVPGFFAGKGVGPGKPPSLDILFITDASGSMNSYINNNILDQNTPKTIESRLLAYDVGVRFSNRYGRATIDKPFLNTNSQPYSGWYDNINDVDRYWPAGDPTDLESVLGNLVPSNQVGNWEDVCGSAVYWPKVNSNFNDRRPLEEARLLLIHASDEQGNPEAGGSRQPNARNEQDVIDYLVQEDVAGLFVGISDYNISSPAPDRDLVIGDEGLRLGAVFLTSDRTTVIWQTGGGPSGTEPYYETFPASEVSLSPGFEQEIDTERIARETNGAIYDVDRVTSSAGQRVFAQSLGDVLGNFLFFSA